MSDTSSLPDPPVLNILGEKVALGPHRRDLLSVYWRWINDFAVTRTLDVGMRPRTFASEEAWYEHVSRSADEVGFTIYERATLRPIGATGLHKIDPQHRTADFGIMLGEQDCWGRGYGTEATRLVLEYGFTALGLHNVILRVFSFNERAIRAYQRAGFREIGRRRQAHRLAGRIYDVVYMDCLASEFQGVVLRPLLPDQ